MLHLRAEPVEARPVCARLRRDHPAASTWNAP